jgi:hypothetical protein
MPVKIRLGNISLHKDTATPQMLLALEGKLIWFSII